MNDMEAYELDGAVTQPYWDRDVGVRLRVPSGAVVVFDCPEPCGQVEPGWTTADLRRWDSKKVHALVGSVHVEGTQPGEVLEVRMLGFEHRGWAWSAVLPGFGLLKDDIPGPYLHHWRLDARGCHFQVGDIVVPCAPFCGCVGVAPGQPGRLDTIPPRDNGGNIDARDLTVDSSAFLPVFVEGGMFACGDCHAAQGHGEVSGTGVEAPMRVTVQLIRRTDLSLDQLTYRTPATPAAPSAASASAAGGCHVTTAHGPDLYEAARGATLRLVEWIVKTHALTPEQALILCGAAADLRINQIVNAPNYLVSAALPLSIFPSSG